MELLDCADCPNPNDVYGKMFFYLRNLLVQFQARAKKMRIRVRVKPFDIKRPLREPDGGFKEIVYDRIEVRTCNMRLVLQWS